MLKKNTLVSSKSLSKAPRFSVPLNHSPDDYPAFQSFKDQLLGKTQIFETFLMSDNSQKRLRNFLERRTDQQPKSSRNQRSALFKSKSGTTFSDSPKKTLRSPRKDFQSPQNILYKLERRLYPHTETYKMKRLKALTLLTPSMSQKGTLSFKINEKLRKTPKQDEKEKSEEHFLS